MDLRLGFLFFFSFFEERNLGFESLEILKALDVISGIEFFFAIFYEQSLGRFLFGLRFEDFRYFAGSEMVSSKEVDISSNTCLVT